MAMSARLRRVLPRRVGSLYGRRRRRRYGVILNPASHTIEFFLGKLALGFDLGSLIVRNVWGHALHLLRTNDAEPSRILPA